MGKHSHDSFGDIQASVGQVSAGIGVISAWFLLVVAVGVAIAGIWIFANSRKDPNATADQKKTGMWWLVGGGIAIVVAVFNLFISRWWNSEVHHNKGFAEAAGTMAELSAITDAFRPPMTMNTNPTQSSGFSINF